MTKRENVFFCLEKLKSNIQFWKNLFSGTWTAQIIRMVPFDSTNSAANCTPYLLLPFQHDSKRDWRHTPVNVVLKSLSLSCENILLRYSDRQYAYIFANVAKSFFRLWNFWRSCVCIRTIVFWLVVLLLLRWEHFRAGSMR